MSEQFNLVKQLADMQNNQIDKHIKKVTFNLSKRPRKSQNTNEKLPSAFYHTDVRTDCAPFIIMRKILPCFLVSLVRIPWIQGILLRRLADRCLLATM